MKRHIILCFLAVLVPCLAWATQYTVLPLEGEKSIADPLSKQLVEWLKLSEENEVSLAEITLKEAIESFGCSEESNSCMSQVGEMLNTDQLVWGKLVREKGALKLKLHQLDVSAALLLQNQEIAAQPSKGESDEQALAKAAETFVKVKILQLPEALQEGWVPLKVITKPDGATVIIDGQNAGLTPYEGKLEPGPHEVELRLAGYDKIQRRIKASDSELVLKLSMKETKPQEVGAQKAGKPASFWIGVGTGILAASAIGYGIYTSVEAVDYRDKANKAEQYTDYASYRNDFDSMKTQSVIAWWVAGTTTLASCYFFFIHEHLFDRSTALIPTHNGFSFYTQF